MTLPGWPVGALAILVLLLKRLSQDKRLAGIFHWLPVPLWCYILPMTAVALGWLPSETSTYKSASDALLPVALALLLLGVDFASVFRTGKQALVATAAGALAVMGGAILGVRMLQPWLPAEAWKGAGALAATWTGGTMNLLSLRTILSPPEAVFAPLILVDALVAYSWMALLVAASSHQQILDRWLLGARAETQQAPLGHPAPSTPAEDTTALSNSALRDIAIASSLAVGLMLVCRTLAKILPQTPMTSSPTAWTVLLITTGSLMLAAVPAIRRLGSRAEKTGSTLLCLVLSLAGAQASLNALWSAPAWIGVGAVVLALHGGTLLAIGKLRRIPLRILATASQANIGGFVSAPMVGAIYHPTLAPVGLLLAIGCNAIGTYAGLITAAFCRR